MSDSGSDSYTAESEAVSVPSTVVRRRADVVGHLPRNRAFDERDFPIAVKFWLASPALIWTVGGLFVLSIAAHTYRWSFAPLYVVGAPALLLYSCREWQREGGAAGHTLATLKAGGAAGFAAQSDRDAMTGRFRGADAGRRRRFKPGYTAQRHVAPAEGELRALHLHLYSDTS